MPKQKKRERKFNVTGGVKARLEKGTVTNKGKLRKRKKQSSGDETRAKKTAVNQGPTKDRSDGFVGAANLGEMDIDTFFTNFADSVEKAIVDEENQDGSSADEHDMRDDEEKGDSDGPSDDNEESLNGEDSDDEDIEAAEARMKAEMAKISKSDPEFHEFLQENEQALLQFGEEDEEMEEADAKEEASDDEETKNADSSGIHLTRPLFKRLIKHTFTAHSLKSLKQLVSAFKSACHLADDTASNQKTRVGESGNRYVIDSSKLFDELMVVCLNQCHREFRHHLLGDQEKDEDLDEETESAKASETMESPISPKQLEKSPRWIQLKPVLSSFLRSMMHVLATAKEPDLLTFILKASSKIAPFMTPFPNLVIKMQKVLTDLWSAPVDTQEEYQVVRLNAFFRIRQLAVTQPFPFIEDCLKKTYLAYAKRAKFGTSSAVASTLPTLTFMGNCLVELYSLDYHSSYQHAFVYIRQLALLLRTALQKKTPEALQQVFSWQYIHCLKLWVAVLAAAAPAEDGALMRSLIYPLTEIIFGTARLAPASARFLPLRFHCVRLLQQLAAASEIFIPTTSILLDCLDLKEWYMKPKKSKKGNARGLSIIYMLKFPKEDAFRTHEQLEEGINEFFTLMEREIDLYRFSAGFPEFSVRITQRLKQMQKETRTARLKTFCRACLDTCERYSSQAVVARAKLNEAPKDVKMLECLRPSSEKSMRERYAGMLEKEKQAAQSRISAATKVSSKAKVPSKSKDEKIKKASIQSKKKQAVPQVPIDSNLLNQEDDVEEGVDWSDDES